MRTLLAHRRIILTVCSPDVSWEGKLGSTAYQLKGLVGGGGCLPLPQLVDLLVVVCAKGRCERTSRGCEGLATSDFLFIVVENHLVLVIWKSWSALRPAWVPWRSRETTRRTSLAILVRGRVVPALLAIRSGLIRTPHPRVQEARFVPSCSRGRG